MVQGGGETERDREEEWQPISCMRTCDNGDEAISAGPASDDHVIFCSRLRHRFLV